MGDNNLLMINKFKVISELDEVDENHKLYYFVNCPSKKMKKELHDVIKEKLENIDDGICLPAGYKRGKIDWTKNKTIGICSMSVCDFVYEKGINPIRYMNDGLYIWGNITTLKSDFDSLYSYTEIITRMNILSFLIDNFECLFECNWSKSVMDRFHEISLFTMFMDFFDGPERRLEYRMRRSILYKLIYCDDKEKLQNEFNYLKKMFIEKEK